MQDAVAETDTFTGDRRDALAGNHDSDEIGRVGSCNRDDAIGVPMPCGAKRLDGFGQCELLAAEARDEAASTDLSARLKATQDADEIAPAWSVRLAREQIAEEYTVTGKKLAGEGFKRSIGATGLLDARGRTVEVRGKQRPPAGGAARGAPGGWLGS